MSTLNTRIGDAFERYGNHYCSLWYHISPITQSKSLREDLLTVNRFFRITLGLLDTDTTLERQYLTNEVDLNEWLEGFEEVILPTLMNNRVMESWESQLLHTAEI